jgi:O-Antigen ligase
MKLAVNILQKGALAYSIVCIVQALFLPTFLETKIDNYLFIFGVLNLAVIFYANKEWRKIIIAFVLFFCWTLIVEIWIKGQTAIHSLPYLLYFIKWPVILFTLMNEFKSGKPIYLPKIVDATVLVLVGLNLLMFINPNGIGEALQNLYAPKEYVNFVYYNEIGVYRLAGTQMNPNDNAILFCGFFIYYMLLRPKQWYLVLLCAGMIILTQSRTIFLVSLLTAVIVALKNYGGFKNKKRLLIITSGGIAVLAGLIFSSSNLRSIFSGEAFVSNSLMVRVKNLYYSLESDWTSSIIGHGVIENPVDQLGFYIDSEFVAIIIQYGWVGLALWLWILVSIIIHKPLKMIRGQYWILIIMLVVGASLTNYSLLHGTIGVIVVTLLAILNGDLKESVVGSPEKGQSAHT